MSNDILPSAKSVRAKVKQKPYNKPHMIIPQEDLDWLLEQKPSVVKLCLECWKADPYGSRWMPLNTSLVDKTLKVAKAVLRKKNLFDFKTELRILEGKRYYETYIINLHGSRRKEFWGSLIDDPTSEEVAGGANYPKQGNEKPHIEESITPGGVIKNPTNSPQSTTQQDLQNASGTSHEHLTNSSKEFVRCETAITNEKLTACVEGARRGVKPTNEEIVQLRDSTYWESFRAAANEYGWDLSQYQQGTMPPGMKEQVAEQMRSLKERKKFRLNS
ncbi:MAG: hypothetical protein KME38_30700 [Spirirestis rafaelensis WJT71-NPBG6]|jgi:hypothetical protein|nr:hypothetical protein [Spirirestis rafaelensis WJT71-NPBG6]